MKEKNTFDSHLKSNLKKRIEEGKATKSDKLAYARVRFHALARSNPKTRFNLVGRLRDKSLMSDKRINRIIAGKPKTHRDRLLDSHSESLADRIKSKAEENKKNISTTQQTN